MNYFLFTKDLNLSFELTKRINEKRLHRETVSFFDVQVEISNI